MVTAIELIVGLMVWAVGGLRRQVLRYDEFLPLLGKVEVQNKFLASYLGSVVFHCFCWRTPLSSHTGERMTTPYANVPILEFAKKCCSLTIGQSCDYESSIDGIGEIK